MRTMLLILAVTVLGVAGYFLPADALGGDAPQAAESAPSIQVTVTGAVCRPGTVEIARGGTVEDAIMAAGGLLPRADASGIQMDETVTPSSAVHVPFSR